MTQRTERVRSYQAGDALPVITKKITQGKVNHYAKVSGDGNQRSAANGPRPGASKSGSVAPLDLTIPSPHRDASFASRLARSLAR